MLNTKILHHTQQYLGLVHPVLVGKDADDFIHLEDLIYRA